MSKATRQRSAPPEIVNRRPRARLLGALGWLMALGVAVGVACGLAVLVLYAHAASTLPPVPPFEHLKRGGITTVSTHDGLVLGEFFEERRPSFEFDDIPAGLILAVLAAEDERFFEHSGLDVRGLARAVVTNLRAGGFVEGASTITQQLAKSVLGRPEAFGHDAKASLLQKAREAIYARRLEDVYSKEQILLLYLNRIYFGHGSYGVRAAAQNYFRKDLSELTLGEMAMLAGLPQAPSALNPLRNPDRARTRQVHVLNQMVRNGFIQQDERDRAVGAQLVVFPLADPLGARAPYFTAAVVRELDRRFTANEGLAGWRGMALRVETTASLTWHRAAERRLDEGLTRLDHDQGFRGPLVKLGEGDRAEFLERVAAELRGRAPAEGDVWPAVIEDVQKKTVRVRLTTTLAGEIGSKGFRWAGTYAEGKKPSFGRKLKDARKALAVGDVVLVRVTGGAGEALTFDLTQEPKVEGAAVVIDPATGYVPLLQGGWDWDRSEVNRIESIRQTGSAIKPAIYSLAYDLGLAPSTLLSGAPFREGDWAPTRGKGKDDLMAWDALAKSENNVTLRVMSYVRQNGGVERIQDWFRRLGLDKPVHGYAAEVLGVDQTPMGLTRMMSTFARGGATVEPRLLRKITTPEGRVLLRPSAFQDPMNEPVDVLDALRLHVAVAPERAIPAPTAYITASNLREVFRRGTARKEGRSMKVPAAGKTGSLPYDVWFTGFTRSAVATVWVGADRRERILGASRRKSRVYGGNTALPVWRDLLNDVVGTRPADSPVGSAPADVVVVDVDPETGWLSEGKGRKVPHRKGTEPVMKAPPSVDPDASPDLLGTDF